MVAFRLQQMLLHIWIKVNTFLGIFPESISLDNDFPL